MHTCQACRILAALTFAALAPLSLADDAAPPAPIVPAAEGAAEAPEPAEADEVMTVFGERQSNSESRRSLYHSVAKAQRLYKRGRYAEAFPQLLNAAERGFKGSQAMVGHIYLDGLGKVDANSTKALGWLGVAADGNTSPAIRNFFQDVWQRIPEPHVPYFEEVVEDYRERYGEDATGVVCRLNRTVDTFVKALGCRVDASLPDEVEEGLDDYQSRAEAVAVLAEQIRTMEQVVRDVNPQSGLIVSPGDRR